MTETLPPTYWDDVNRYCGDLLSGARLGKASIWIVSAAVQKASWPAQTEGATATLQRTVTAYWGGLRRNTQHMLRLQNPISHAHNQTVYEITFDPKQQVIQEASSLAELKLPEPPTEIISPNDAFAQLQRMYGYLNERAHERAEFKALGLHLPGPWDYDLLLNELKNGVSRM